jgi:hypothetical protein
MTLFTRRLLGWRRRALRAWTLDPTARNGESTGCRRRPKLSEMRIVMDSFVIRPTTWPVLRIFSRNPLVRNSDRIEAAVVPLAALFVIVAIACAGVLGTLAHDVEARRYLEEAKTRHTVVVTAVGDSTPGTIPQRASSNVAVRWRANGVDHAELIAWDQPVKAGEPLMIWVGTDGNRVDAPTPPALAGANAALTAAVSWWIMFLIAAMTVGAARARAARMRNTQWDRDIRCLVDDEDGRTNHSQ